MENIFVEFLPPWIETGLQPAFYDKESGTVLQQTARMYARVNMLIRMFNKLSKNTKTTVEDYINKFNELYDYVHDYFDNLDVQEEINNKLDEMYEDGTLTEVIGNYIEVAKKSYIIKEINYEKFYLENNKGNVYITKIPHLDNDGNIIKAKHGFANDRIDNGEEEPTEFSYRNHCTMVANASVSAVQAQVSANIQLGELLGLYIHDGEVVKDNRQYLTSSFLLNRWILGFTEDGTMKTYVGSTDSTTILNDGVIETYQGFIPLMVEGDYYKPTLQNMGVTYWSDTTFTQTTDETPNYSKIYYTLDNNVPTGHFHLTEFASGVTYYDEVTSGDQLQPRQIICQDANKNIFFITNDGRGKTENVGMSLNDFYTIAKYYQATFAFVLDGGGSTCTVVNNIMLNNPLDDKTSLSSYTDGMGYTIRKVPDFIYFSKDIKTEYDSNINNIYEILQKLNKKINDNTLTQNQKQKSVTEFYEDTNQQHRFDFKQWDSSVKDFVNSMQIFFNNSTSYPGGLSITDVANNIQVLRIRNNIEQGILYLGKQLATLYNDIEEVTDSTTDLDNLTPTAIAMQLKTNLNLTNQPFTTTDGSLYWLMQWGGSYYKFQIALSMNSTPKIRIRVKTDGTWKPWRKIDVTSVS